ncbi:MULTISPECIES: sensor histidine kinase [unclassified Caballeronia]|uniref:sensor histidine kinase n=1 Tax=unclassified Caballeronia TaxID=2646786 RepID=UPI0028589587|nr:MULTISPECIES: sensor histidine kinase [unclassified Caballeronia]MDR5771135.1 sensor histidine kinase [Caballeronia sp. LZ002]MDR5846572.1 sensor histidine kinase [Caballeronia sp. LZ003]
MSHVLKDAAPAASETPQGLARRATRINEWMHRYSWAVAMTVAIVITVGGLVILESGRMRIAAEYETALDAKSATAQLSSLAADIATLSAEERGFALAADDTYKSHFAQTAGRVRRALTSLDSYYRRIGDDAALASFAQIRAAADENIAQGEAHLADLSKTPADAEMRARVVATPSPDTSATLDAALALLRLNEEQRAQHALDASRADQRISTLCVGALCALNIVLFLLLFRNLGIQLDKQDRVQKKLITQQEELDRLVFERTRQLEALAWHLQSVSENEKTELARELHDELGSILTASKMDVAWVRGKLRTSEPAMSDKLARAIGNLDQGIALKRRIIEDMRPTVLANFGLVTALRSLADEAAQRNGWSVEFDLPGDDVKLGEAIEIALFRVAQETLTNAAKYARANRIEIALALVGDDVALAIADDGIGIRPQDLKRTQTHGLVGMRQRVSARGGRFEIERVAPHGTRISVSMPRERSAGTFIDASAPAAVPLA